jgi:hypothetical protein
MKTEVHRLASSSEGDYEELLMQAPQAMLYHSLKYRDFLRSILRDATDCYLLAYNGGRLVSAMPSFCMDGPLGVVINSLPFFGSHGSIIARRDAPIAAIQALFDAFNDLCREKAAICSTIVTNPFESNSILFSQYPVDYVDERIGQITPLPPRDPEADLDARLMALLHQKTRNMVRKGAKSGFDVGHECSPETLKALHSLHDENIRCIGGIPKAWNVFQAIMQVFSYDRDYRVYVARNHDGQIVSGLLVFYFKDTVEYFIPATLAAYRSYQPLSFLIYSAMKDAILERQARYWNWGGTWLSQNGVYAFKSKWGTQDFPYRYYIKEYLTHGRMAICSRAELLNGYPYFYTIPFKELKP